MIIRVISSIGIGGALNLGKTELSICVAAVLQAS